MPQSDQAWNEQIIKEFHENHGKVGGMFKDADLLILHTTGARSGKERINPLGYLPYDNRIFIIASDAGGSVHPNWYFNLLAHPDVSVEIGDEALEARAVVVKGEERDTLYNKVCERYATFIEYQKKAHPRVIPVVELVFKKK